MGLIKRYRTRRARLRPAAWTISTEGVGESRVHAPGASEGVIHMGLTKHGQGEVLREPEEQTKTANKNWTSADQQALDKENVDADDEGDC